MDQRSVEAGVELTALNARPATERPRGLTPGQERQVYCRINGRDLRQHLSVAGTPQIRQTQL
jgi:hypothetical protein